jgi:uncharacterized repeat protein (TIGR01451 family)
MFAERRGTKGWVLAAFILMVPAARLQAAAAPEVKVNLSGSVQKQSKTGAAWVTLENGSQVAPGEQILYKVDLSNRGDREARNPMALGPIPAGTAYVPGSATTGRGLRVEYSVDGGKTFAEKPTITVTGKDGSRQTLPAPTSRYTTIRWSWEAPLAAGATAGVSYMVEVR